MVCYPVVGSSYTSTHWTAQIRPKTQPMAASPTPRSSVSAMVNGDKRCAFLDGALGLYSTTADGEQGPTIIKY